MTALSDIQQALNVIRRITQSEEQTVRLAALALLAGVMGDEARDIAKQREPKRKQQPAVPIPRPPKPTVRPAPMPQDKGVQTVPNVQALAPKQAQKPIPPQ